jgi:hypothetical protein
VQTAYGADALRGSEGYQLERSELFRTAISGGVYSELNDISDAIISQERGFLMVKNNFK